MKTILQIEFSPGLLVFRLLSATTEKQCSNHGHEFGLRTNKRK